MTSQQRIAIFGASGAIGLALTGWFAERGWQVLAVSRSGTPAANAQAGVRWLACDPTATDFALRLAEDLPPLDAAIWAQGQNFNDDLYTMDVKAHESMYKANVMYILQTLQALLQRQRLIAPARLCVISSIWQNLARQNKLSYTVTKAALQGLVLSAALDLGKDGHLINAVLPGALDTPMTRANLSGEQIGKLEQATFFNRLSTLEDVCSLAGFLCSSANTGITGQFIAADQGFSHARII